ncbi:MAG: hypothetical protein P4L51_24980 [Puia sp.]|nr:hypothetical protein [Puia sp.]
MPSSILLIDNDLASKLLIASIAAVLGYLSSVLIDRFKNRLLVLKKKISYQLVGMSSLTDTWGDIRITWNGDPVNNLYFFNAEIMNDTGRDAPKDLAVTFSVEPGCFFYTARGVLRNGDAALGLKLQDEYFNQFLDIRQRWFALPLEQRNPQSPIFEEVELITRHKKFVLPILNRKATADFDFMIASNISEVPILTIGVYEPGISITWFESVKRKKRRKLWTDLLITILYVGFTFPIIIYSPSKTSAAWLMVVNTFIATYLGKGISYLLKAARVI